MEKYGVIADEAEKTAQLELKKKLKKSGTSSEEKHAKKNKDEPK